MLVYQHLIMRFGVHELRPNKKQFYNNNTKFQLGGAGRKSSMYLSTARNTTFWKGSVPRFEKMCKSFLREQRRSRDEYRLRYRHRSISSLWLYNIHHTCGNNSRWRVQYVGTTACSLVIYTSATRKHLTSLFQGFCYRGLMDPLTVAINRVTRCFELDRVKKVD